MIQIYMGDGKGKTTAAIGGAVRALGGGMRVLFCQFMKDGSSGELSVLSRLDGVRVICAPVCGFPKEITPAVRATQLEVLDKIGEVLKIENYNLLILDEIFWLTEFEIIDEKYLTDFLKNHADIEIVMTGRYVPQAIADFADYVSEVKKIKHPYDKKMPSRRGIEY